MQFYFSDNPLLAQLETTAKSQGLQFIDELIFENGAVYKGKKFFQLFKSLSWPPEGFLII